MSHLASMSLPASRSGSTSWLCPCRAARWSGVCFVSSCSSAQDDKGWLQNDESERPLLTSTTSALAPCSSRSRARPVWPCFTAMNRPMLSCNDPLCNEGITSGVNYIPAGHTPCLPLTLPSASLSGSGAGSQWVDSAAAVTCDMWHWASR